MSTTINITVGDDGLPERNRQQTAANRQAYVQGKASEQAAQTGLERRAADRTAAGLDPATGRILVPSSGGGFRRLDQQPAANRRSDSGAFGFLLRPQGGINPALIGPYGEQNPSPSDLVWGGHGGIRGLSRGYSNKLWGTVYPPSLQFIPVSSPNLRPLYGFGGLYAPRNTYEESYQGLRTDVGAFILSHLVALGTDIRFYSPGVIDPNIPTYLMADGSPIIGVKKVSSSCTLEFIVRLGAVAPSLNLGNNTVVVGLNGTYTPTGFFQSHNNSLLNPSLIIYINVSNYSGSSNNELFIPGVECYVETSQTLNPERVYLPSSFGGRDLHIASVVTGRVVRLYVDGILRSTYTEEPGALMITESPSLNAQVFVEDDAQDDNATGDSIDNTTFYNGPTVFKGIRYTDRALYTGTSFTPPTSLTRLA